MRVKNQIPLAEAALELGISWERAWRHVLTGQLQGEKRNGKWMVAVSSIRGLKRRMLDATPVEPR